MKRILEYSFKVWFTAIVFTPTLAYLVWEIGNAVIAYINRDKAFNNGLIFGTDGFKLSNIPWNLLFNAPFYSLYLVSVLIAFLYFRQSPARSGLIKLVLIIISIMLTFIYYAIFNVKTMNMFFNERLAWITSFEIFFIMGVWYYRLDINTDLPFTKRQ